MLLAARKWAHAQKKKTVNYQRIYNQLIKRAQIREELIGYTERHHIIPRCLGGNEKDNLVYLTAREHFIAHKLLYFINPENEKLFYAYWYMSTMTNNDNQERNYHIGSHEYERLKILMSERKKGKPRSEKTKQKIREAKLGSTHTDETKQKIRNGRLGTTHTLETIQKIRAANIGKIYKKVTCPHCESVGGVNIMKRHHFDNCKEVRNA